jgi:signal transduction histidine kinase
LSLRILALFVAGILVLLAVDGVLLVRREVGLLDRDEELDAVNLGRSYGLLLAQVLRLEGVGPVAAVVQRLDGADPDARVRWFPPGEEPVEAGAPWPTAQERARLHAGDVVTGHRRAADGEERRLTWIPVAVEPDRIGTLELSESLAGLVDSRRRLIARAVVVGVLSALLGLALSWLILRPLLGRPLDRLVRKTASIGAGDFAGDLRMPGLGELTDLAEAMNRMCAQLEEARASLLAETSARIETLEQLRQADRLAVLGRIASGLAHEMGTPLNVVSGRAAMIDSGELEADEVADCARIIGEQTARMTSIIRQFLDYARRSAGDRRPQRVEELVAAAAALLRPSAAAAGVTIVQETAEDLPPVPADPEQLQQVLTNLLMNAVHAMPEGGEVRVRAAREGDRVRIEVADQGAGIAPDDLPQIFQPFFTTKPTGQGTGLGLSIVKEIVEAHGGDIEAASERGRGAVFTILLPAES